AKESTGLTLLLLVVGDLVAVTIYRKNVDWKLLVSAIVPVLVGLAAGAFFLVWVDDGVLRRTMGVMLLALLALGLLPGGLIKVEKRPVAHSYGALAGFSTMVANAGGAALNLYLLAAKFEKWRFIATTAWFFFVVNIIKVPISVGIGIITWPTVGLAAVLVPAVLIGAWVGRLVIKHVDQKLFDRLVTGLTAVSALYLALG
ncbi:MAG: sulfite exporter TauE/SafE family protein, partial [Propionibacteriaceae bacterium]|nr:sulfite exporter TauE/SafE family protein [Propionibacteriaceae bacterium]